MLWLRCIEAILLLQLVVAQELPTLYEYYTEGGIQSGLEATAEGFKLNGKDISIYSGTIHYFRVHPDYWRSSLRKARAAGLVAVETYIPWNLHEPQMDVYDFGDGDNDMSKFLNVTRYIQIAQEEDLLVIVRPGPYICSEYEFGGFPSWLVRYPGIGTRTNDTNYIERMKIYFNKVLPLFTNLQFTEGGPIIIFQIENEYGYFNPISTDYLEAIRQSFTDNGLKELFVTSDGPWSGDAGSLPGVLKTINFNSDPNDAFPQLQQLQPDKPLMAMEFWSGWFDHWLDSSRSTGLDVNTYATYLEHIMLFNASMNIYMFQGGTNFGYLNGASLSGDHPYYSSIVSSYDYDAPLSEAGDYTEKYQRTKEIIAQYNKVQTRLPDPPEETPKAAYPTAEVQEFLSYTDIIDRVDASDKVQIEQLISMEDLDVNGGSGQNFGYVNYRKSMQLQENSVLKISGHVRDIAIILVDGLRKTKALTSPDDIEGFGYWVNSDLEFNFDPEDAGNQTVDIFVENWGRDNGGNTWWLRPAKGLWEGPVLLDGEELANWEAISLPLTTKFIKGLDGWKAAEETITGPALLRGTFNVDSPADTFVDMSSWGKGIVFINGFNIGRYLNIGPSKTLYVPAPLLSQGENEVIVFEHYTPSSQIIFSDTPNLG